MTDTRENIRQELVENGGFKATLKGKKEPTILAEWQEIPDENHPQHDAIVQLHIAFFEAYSERLKKLRVLDMKTPTLIQFNVSTDSLPFAG